MIGHAVIRPTGVMVLPYSALAHIGPIFLLLYLLKNPKEFLDRRIIPLLALDFVTMHFRVHSYLKKRFKRNLFLNIYL